MLKEKISERFPLLSFTLIKLCVTTGRQIKKLNEEIKKKHGNGKANLPFPYLPSVCDENWYAILKSRIFELSEHLKFLKEENAKVKEQQEWIRNSILTWHDFSELASKFYIFEEHHERVAIFLRHMGIIHHYRGTHLGDELKAFHSIIFLDLSV